MLRDFMVHVGSLYPILLRPSPAKYLTKNEVFGQKWKNLLFYNSLAQKINDADGIPCQWGEQLWVVCGEKY